MSFTSWQFLLFLLPVLALYYWPPLRSFQVSLLVLASLLFYGLGQPELLPILFVTVFGSFACLRAVVGGSRQALVLGIVFNLAILAFFKYKFLFLNPGKAAAGDGVFDLLLALPLPVGISFFVFHNISMLVDFWKERPAAGKLRLRDAFLYILFFPQLVSGPITRARAFFPQIVAKRLSDIDLVSAVRWLAAGFFMKLFCANNLNQFTALMDNSPVYALHAPDRILLVFLYGFQIYADFFGYSAIAIGLALLFGYRLPENFRRPYLASSFADFWTRWHISLSNWLRNYLYIPLGGNRAGEGRTYLNLLVVMALGGLWHGAGLNYLVWGLAHGLFLVVERPLLPLKERLSVGSRWRLHGLGAVHTAIVFLCVTWAWLLFRLPTFEQAVAYTGQCLQGPWLPGLPLELYVVAAGYSAPVLVQHFLPGLTTRAGFRRLEPVFYALVVFLAVIEAGPDSPFIYFQF